MITKQKESRTAKEQDNKTEKDQEGKKEEKYSLRARDQDSKR